MKPCDQFVGSKKAGQCKNATPSAEPYSRPRAAQPASTANDRTVSGTFALV